MARILCFFYGLLIFVSLFMVATNQSIPDVLPCLFSNECPPDLCPTDLFAKCINLTCQCTAEYDLD
ncbi:Nodule Cysteine-Rich (NCR) secreted peptide [Medicago truncatula]|uniref:Nodule Cysteine-Rich (NCR) secreted peptide n=2 Tax=Medicago truncatula TaxID=3880 RepID=G7L159_MEDTR|nr:Nodule Cysteine-Rich (NCR) secreted peptide [Medicago truncatula]